MASVHDDTHTLHERQNNVSLASLSIKMGMQLRLLTARWQCWPSLEAMLRERCVPFTSDFSVDVWCCVEAKDWGNQSDVYHKVHFCNLEQALKTSDLSLFVNGAPSQRSWVTGVRAAHSRVATGNSQSITDGLWEELPAKTPVKMKPPLFYISVLSIIYYVYSFHYSALSRNKFLGG